MNESALGITSRRCHETVDQVLGRLVAQLDDRGIDVFAVVDHSGDARDAGLTMADTKLVIFGNPVSIAPLVAAHPLLALELPLRLLIWETTDQRVFVSYNSPRYLAERYGLPAEHAEPFALIEAIARSLSAPD